MTIPGATNINTNPSFESAFTGWTAYQSTQTTPTDGTAWVGLKYARLVASNGNFPGAYFDQTVTAGQVFRAAGRFRIPVGRAGMVICDVFNGSNALIQGGPRVAVAGNGSWQLIVADFVLVPAGAAYIRNYFVLDQASAVAGDILGLDGVDMRLSSQYDTYIDGDQGGVYHWNGTAQLSSAYRDDVAEAMGSGAGGLVVYDLSILRVDIANNAQADPLDYGSFVTDGSVTMSIDQAVPMSLNLTMVGANPFIPYSDFLAPILGITTADGVRVSAQIGLFVVTPPTDNFNEGSAFTQIRGYDLTYLMGKSAIVNGLTVRKGAEPISELIAILKRYGFRYVRMAKSSAAMAADKTWTPGTSISQIAADLCAAAGYYPPWAEFAYIVSRPFDVYATISSSVTYDTTQTANPVIGTVLYDASNDQFANQVIVVVDNPNNAPIIRTATNNSPASPVSTVSIGSAAYPITIPLVINDANIADAATAQATANALLQQRSSFYTTIDLTTLPDPTRGLHEYYTLNIVDTTGANAFSAVTGVWDVRGWTLNLGPTPTPMVHHIAKTQTVEQVT